MTRSSRRSFLTGVGTLISGLTTGSTPTVAKTTTSQGVAPANTLSALGEVVLPARALGEEGLAVAVAGFIRWRDALSPGAELDHAYLSTDELQFAPGDKRSEWQAQLEQLEARSRQDTGRAFAELTLAERTRRVEAAIGEPPERMPHASEAQHVATAMAAWYFATPAANDLCYGARIGRHACRGLPTAPDEPAPFVAADAGEVR
jgi:hypothetical protein